jgi:hypothetical protein
MVCDAFRKAPGARSPVPDFGIRLHPVMAVSPLAQAISMLLFDVYDIYDAAISSARGRRAPP